MSRIKEQVSMIDDVLRTYIPSMLHQDFVKAEQEWPKDTELNAHALFESVLEHSDNQCRMYGSARELLDNLRIYYDFPLNNRILGSWFNRIPSDYVQSDFKPYSSLKGEIFYDKFDFSRKIRFEVLKRCITENGKFHSELKYMNDLGRDVENYEFVRFDKNEFDKICDHILKSVSDRPNVEDVVSKFPEYFSSRSKIKHPTSPLVVRVFEDGDRRFVLESEIFQNSEIENPKYYERSTHSTIYQYTMDLDVVYKTYRDHVSDFEFIRVPVRRTKHAVVPILAPMSLFFIPSSDGLLQTLRHLISGAQFLQNMNIELLNKYMDILQRHYSIKDTGSLISSIIVCTSAQFFQNKFKKEDESVTYVQVKSIVEDFDCATLIEELKRLRLENLFPEISDHAKRAYEEVKKSRKRCKLRTCDMIDAIEMCQIICILNRYPELKQFLHNQKACHRVSLLQCETCDRPSNKFESTVWNDYTKASLKFPKRFLYHRKEINWEMVIETDKDEITLRTNLSLLSDDELYHNSGVIFLLDDDDMSYDRPSNTINEFTKNRLNKKIYIRTVKSPESRRVFTMEVLEIIPILLRKQSYPKNNNLLDKYKQIWKSDNELNYYTISLEEFNEVLKEFDIDKRQITIVPDPIDIENEDIMEEYRMPRQITAPNGKIVMSLHQVIFMIFKMTIVGINWNLNYCSTHPNCIDSLKQQIIKTMKEYEEARVGTYFYKLDWQLLLIHQHCTVQHWLEQPNPGYESSENEPYLMWELPHACYAASAEAYGLPVYSNPRKESVNMVIWMHKLLFMKGYLETFFNRPDLYSLRRIILEMMALKIPKEGYEREDKHLIPQVLSLPPSAKPEAEYVSSRNSEMELVQGIQRLQGELNQMYLKNEELKQKVERYEQEKCEVEKDRREMQSQLEESNRLADMNLEKAKEAQEEVKRLKMKNGVLNKEIDRLNLESSKMKKVHLEQEKKINQLEKSATKSADEIKKLKAAKETKEAQMKQTNKGLTESIRILQQKVSDLKEKSNADHLEMAMKQSHLEDVLKDKERVILNLQESRTLQTAEQDKAKEELHNRISLISSQHKQHWDDVLNELIPSTPQDSALLISLQKTRDKLRDDSPLKLAKEMVEKLISLSSRPEIHQMAQYEYEQYEGKVCVYVQELEVSIDKLNDKSCMTTPPIPSQFPSFSDRFMNEYWMEIDKSRDQKEDNKCLICFFEMTHETDTLKCEECKKVIHMECASKWLKIHRSCPHCRREQLDPNEFPALQ